MYIALVLIGTLHGLVLLPVMLSFYGPDWLWKLCTFVEKKEKQLLYQSSGNVINSTRAFTTWNKDLIYDKNVSRAPFRVELLKRYVVLDQVPSQKSPDFNRTFGTYCKVHTINFMTNQMFLDCNPCISATSMFPLRSNLNRIPSWRVSEPSQCCKVTWNDKRQQSDIVVKPRLYFYLIRWHHDKWRKNLSRLHKIIELSNEPY